MTFRPHQSNQSPS